MPLQESTLIADRYQVVGEPEHLDGHALVLGAEDTRLGRRVVLVLGEEGGRPDAVRQEALAKDPDIRILDGGRVDDRAFLVLQPEDRTGHSVAPILIGGPVAPAPTEVVPALRDEHTKVLPAAVSTAAAGAAPRHSRQAELVLGLALVALIAAVTLVLVWPSADPSTPVDTGPDATTTTTSAPPTTPAPPTTVATTTAPSTTQPQPRADRADERRGDDRKGDEKRGDG